MDSKSADETNQPQSNKASYIHLNAGLRLNAHSIHQHRTTVLDDGRIECFVTVTLVGRALSSMWTHPYVHIITTSLPVSAHYGSYALLTHGLDGILVINSTSFVMIMQVLLRNNHAINNCHYIIVVILFDSWHQNDMVIIHKWCLQWCKHYYQWSLQNCNLNQWHHQLSVCTCLFTQSSLISLSLYIYI